MGMAASQARLLALTARIHDVELQAQSIQNAKVQLATQSDSIYAEYLEALDATTLTIKDVNGNQIVANFANMTGRNAVLSGITPAFRTTNGRKLIVSSDIYNSYTKFAESASDKLDPYAFAVYMAGGTAGNNYVWTEKGHESDPNFIDNLENTVLENHPEDEELNNIKSSMDEILEANDCKTIQELQAKLSSAETDNEKDEINTAIKEYQNLDTLFNNKFYSKSNYVEEFFTKAGNSEIYDEEEFNYYLNIGKQIAAAGGNITSIDSYDGLDGNVGNAATDSDWLQRMLKCGLITLENVVFDKKTGEASFSTSSPDTDTYVDYTTTTTIDKTAMAKAEAKYEHDMKEIDRKDKQFDMSLSKLETERQALTTQEESLKTVIKDNIERTFGIFS